MRKNNFPAMIPLPQNQAAVNWVFGNSVDQLLFEIDILCQPLQSDGSISDKGIYVILYDQSINGVGAYLGLQTNVMIPGPTGGHIASGSFGLIFSRWGTRSRDDFMPGPGGLSESAGHEGDFVGVRLLTQLKTGRHKVLVKAGKSDSSHIWYDCFLTTPDFGQLLCGSLRFPLIGEFNRGFADGGGTSVELFTTAELDSAMKNEEVPSWKIVITPYAGSGLRPPQHARLTYPYSDAVLSSVSVLNKLSGTIEIEIGPFVSRSNMDGPLF